MKTRPPAQATKGRDTLRSQLDRVLRKLDRDAEIIEARRARVWRAYSKLFNHAHRAPRAA